MWFSYVWFGFRRVAGLILASGIRATGPDVEDEDGSHCIHSRIEDIDKKLRVASLDQVKPSTELEIPPCTRIPQPMPFPDDIPQRPQIPGLRPILLLNHFDIMEKPSSILP